MKCEFCGERMQQAWKFCPACGAMRMDKEHPHTHDAIDAFDDSERTMEAEDSVPHVHTRGGGFSIRIVQTAGKKPRVDIQTFGDIDHEHVQKHVEEHLGLTQSPKKRKKKPSRMLPARSTIEEPISRIVQEDDHTVVEIDLPDVRKKDVRVEDMESSVEIKAVSKKKSFFKILTKPEDASLVGKDFKDGTLRLVFA